jgi:hypothetical protein
MPQIQYVSVTLSLIDLIRNPKGAVALDICCITKDALFGDIPIHIALFMNRFFSESENMLQNPRKIPEGGRIGSCLVPISWSGGL